MLQPRKCPHGRVADDWCKACRDDGLVADARSTREEFRRLDQRVADLESLLHDVDACLEWVWPHFGGDQADKIAALQKRIIDAVSN